MPLTIDWRRVPRDYIYAAQDLSGEVWVFAAEPVRNPSAGIWYDPEYDGLEPIRISTEELNDNWLNTLTERPV